MSGPSQYRRVTRHAFFNEAQDDFPIADIPARVDSIVREAVSQGCARIELELSINEYHGEPDLCSFNIDVTVIHDLRGG